MEEADDWDHPITQEELEAIDAAIGSYSGADRRRTPMNGGCDDLRRRLPHSLARPVNRASNESVLNRCPRNRPIDLDYQSRQANLKMRLPALNFGGRIVYCRTVNEVEKATKELLDLVSTKQRENGEAVLGFDLEWRPTFRRGFSPGKVAVMQICGNTDCCYVIHIIHSGIPQNLQSLLEDPTSTKVGIGIANDSFKLFKDYQISTQSLSDLAGLANQKFGGYPKKWSLEALTESVISKQLPKLKKIRLGNWEVDCLSKEQLQYAATDAYASWYLYTVLENLPDAPKKEGIDGAPSILPDAPKNEIADENLKVRLPTLNFGGRIVYCRTVNEVEKATNELLDLVDTKQRKSGQAVLGLDLEWRPTFIRGDSPGKVAVMQICGDTDSCYVMHIIHSGIPEILKSLLENPISIKVGIGISCDSVKLFKDYQISTKTLSNLSGLANQKLGGKQKTWGLASLTEYLLSKQLPKSNKIMLGNWEADCLSKEQLQYAATDAYASWHLYKVLENLPDAPNNETALDRDRSPSK